MKKKLKDDLIKMFDAPPPVRKREFLRQVSPRPMNMAHILFIQVSYISKLEWVVSAGVFCMIVTISCFFRTAVFGVILALMPFLAAAGVSKSMRSVIYGMDELEMASRFSLKSIILMRMCIAGIENLVLTISAALFMQGKVFQTMVYLLVPYLITVYGCLFIVRNITVKEGLNVCIGLSAAVSLTIGLCSIGCSWIFQERFYILWTAAVVMLLIINCNESRLLLREVECN